MLNGAAARERKHEKKPVAPRDDQFIYSKRIIKETEQKAGKVKTYTDEMWESVDASKRSLSMELGREMWEEPAGKGEGVWPPRRWSGLKKLPQDPEKLISALLSVGGSDDRSFSERPKFDRFRAYFLLGALLKNPVLPQGLRPAAYEALALVPGVETIPGVKDSAGRSGVGVAYTERGPYQGKCLIFDPESYEFLGFRDERTSASGKKKYTQVSHVVEWGIVDRVKQRPIGRCPAAGTRGATGAGRRSPTGPRSCSGRPAGMPRPGPRRPAARTPARHGPDRHGMSQPPRPLSTGPVGGSASSFMRRSAVLAPLTVLNGPLWLAF